MLNPLYIKRHDLQPYYYARAKESTGTVIDLSGATIRASMIDADTGSLKIVATITGVTITAASSGLFQYQWQAADTNTTGTYYMEFEVTPGIGGKFTLPVNREAKVIIVADEDNV